MIPRVPLREALSDSNLLGTAIAGDSWRSWRTLLIAAMGEALREDEREIFSKLTGRDREPLQRVDQFAAVIGRRGGKSRAMATLACYLAGLCEHTDALVPGERGVLLCVALDQRVAKIILDYAEASFERSPILKQLIAGRTADALELTNGITLEVRPASFRKLRGPTYIAVIADELAFWYVDAAYANPDVEILNAVEPGLATTGGPLILASSPHARRGALWDVFKRHYGPGGDPLILVAHGATRALNPSLPQRVVDRALEKDRARATAEYLAQFRTDVEGFVALEAVEACTGDYREMLPAANNFYRAFTDPSGGSDDSFALAISHKSEDRIIIDAIREARPPFSPDAVVNDFAALLKSYRVSRVTGDRYAGEFPRELFRKHGIAYDLAKQTKSELFRDLLPLLNSGRIVLPRNDRLQGQIVGLERRTSAVGRDTISHPDRGHDDVANAVAGAAALSKFGGYDTSMRWVSGDDEDSVAAWERVRFQAFINSEGRIRRSFARSLTLRAQGPRQSGSPNCSYPCISRTTRPSIAPACMRENTSLMFSSRSVATVARTFPALANSSASCRSSRVPTIEPRTVMPFSTMSKIGSGKLPGGNPLSEMVPPRRTMPSACSKAFGETAVTSTP